MAVQHLCSSDQDFVCMSVAGAGDHNTDEMKYSNDISYKVSRWFSKPDPCGMHESDRTVIDADLLVSALD